jgi:VIT1/CCC1 family predicted Fe2+/Mn2+ transporter
LETSIIVSIIYGFVLLTLFSYKLALNEKSKNPWRIVFEHVFITIIVIVVAYFVGILVGRFFV